jgi:GGDEF domain-containing protein
VTICDIDQFKPVNDHNGHAIGDLVLSEVTRILSHHGVAGRLGGDEFVLLAAVPAPTRSPWPKHPRPGPRSVLPRQHRRMASRDLDRVPAVSR